MSWLACGSDRGQPCGGDGDCASGLSCLDGVCAPALDDPGGDAQPAGGPVRLVAVGLHPRLEHVVSLEAWDRFVRDQFRDRVVPMLASDRPNLVVWPENTLLSAVLIGRRGASARTASTAGAAFVSLSLAYDAATQRVTRDRGEPLPGARALLLALTDTLWRALDPFVALAREHGVWMAVTADVAPARRSTDPDDVAAFVDEDVADRSFAWVPDGYDVFNQTLLFDPTGRFVHAFRKEYLVPVEERSDGLALSYGPPGNLRALQLPFGRVASVISKDAWMPDVVDRLALDDVQLWLQPEAFSGWGIPEGEDGAWPPDVVAESGWIALLREAGAVASVLPCWSGNFFELVFDCQTSILMHPSRDAREGAWIGRDPAPGFTVIAPWVIEDDRRGSLEERRARLMEVGRALAPGSGDPRENEYVAGVVVYDVDPSQPLPASVADEAERRVDAMAPGEQRRPAIVATGPDRFAVFFEDDRRGASRIYGALGWLSRDGTVKLGAARMRVRTSGAPRRVRAAAHGARVHLVWQEQRTGTTSVVRYARSDDAGRSFADPVDVSPVAEGVSQRFADVEVDARGRPWVAWVDDRGGAARIWIAHGDGSRFVEAWPALSPPSGAYDPRQSQHAPALAAHADGVRVVFTEFSEYRWRVASVTCTPTGCGELERVDGADVPHETLHADPAADGSWAVWTDLRVRRPDHDVRARRVGGAETPPLASSDAQGWPQLRPDVAALGDGGAVVVWQDARGGRSELRAARLESDGSVGMDFAIFGDDVPRFAPQVVWLEGGPIVAFETTAAGRRQVGVARVRWP
ncbi:MAG: hypothetical protein NZ898_10695 [Myxococcota bacterium]|nr:hypothetical protein [Myxococcota bacterium]MDW8363839.1 hypothetical protein [Myxococcales bacterium]